MGVNSASADTELSNSVSSPRANASRRTRNEAIVGSRGICLLWYIEQR